MTWNENIADLFFRMDMVERTGMGIRKMRTAMLAAGLREPIFETAEPEGFFRAIFRRSPKYALKEGTLGLEDTGKKLRVKTRVNTGEKILDLIRSNPVITAAEVAEVVCLTVKGVEWNIRQLKEKGRLRRIGPDKGGHWEGVKWPWA